jgi:hypothetical protein
MPSAPRGKDLLRNYIRLLECVGVQNENGREIRERHEACQLARQ